jgi:hypothetical protein
MLKQKVKYHGKVLNIPPTKQGTHDGEDYLTWKICSFHFINVFNSTLFLELLTHMHFGSSCMRGPFQEKNRKKK